MSNDDTNWREVRDEDGFPIANEDRDGDLFTDEYNVVYFCSFVEGLGWAWRTLDKGQ